MKKEKFYVVWQGRRTGVFTNWEECRAAVHGFQGARYKSFSEKALAYEALKKGPEKVTTDSRSQAKKKLEIADKPTHAYMAVDAACSGNPGAMEYRGVNPEGVELFRSGVYPVGTNNIGEFLAIVHALAWQQNQQLDLPIYTDSVNAMKWVAEGKAKTKLPRTAKTEKLFEHISRAENWLKTHRVHVYVLKWDTAQWGEIPADFGRK
jgi:ribonuclease HI